MKLPPRKLMTTFRILCALLLLAVSVLPALTPSNAFAAGAINNRSLTLLAGTAGTAGDGGSQYGAVVKHQFTFTAPTSTAVQSIQIQYCTTAANSLVSPVCVGPTGLSVSSATIASQTGTSGWTISSPSANVAILAHATATDISAGVTFTLGNVTNPTSPNLGPPETAYNATFFARITTYTSNNATGTIVDAGAVAAAVTEPIILTGHMPESLVFCAGATVSPAGAGTNTQVSLSHSDGSIPNCASATSGIINFDILFDPNDTATATSQMAASTNAGSGYQITVDGPTLTGASTTIARANSAGAAVASTHGVAQFGMNLVQNVSTMDHTTNCTSAPCPLGIDIDDASNAGTPASNPLMAQPTTNYSTADMFYYNDGDTVAESNNGGTLKPTNGQIYTVSYIVNVPGSQPAGDYTTTLNYICTATY